MHRICYDTVIHSGLTRKDLQPASEMAAVEAIERLHEAGLIKRVTTPVAKDEERRTYDAAVRATLEEAGDVVSAVPSSPVLLGFTHLDYGPLGFISNPVMTDVDETLVDQLVAIGPGRNDARAIAFAAGVNGNCAATSSLSTLKTSCHSRPKSKHSRHTCASRGRPSSSENGTPNSRPPTDFLLWRRSYSAIVVVLVTARGNVEGAR